MAGIVPRCHPLPESDRSYVGLTPPGVPKMSRPHSARIKRFSWEKAYEAAALETDSARLVDRIESLHRTLLIRLLELTNRKEDKQEIEAVDAALRTNRILRQERRKV